jgi:hypothetical protein
MDMFHGFCLLSPNAKFAEAWQRWQAGALQRIQMLEELND